LNYYIKSLTLRDKTKLTTKQHLAGSSCVCVCLPALSLVFRAPPLSRSLFFCDEESINTQQHGRFSLRACHCGTAPHSPAHLMIPPYNSDVVAVLQALCFCIHAPLRARRRMLVTVLVQVFRFFDTQALTALPYVSLSKKDFVPGIKETKHDADLYLLPRSSRVLRRPMRPIYALMSLCSDRLHLDLCPYLQLAALRPYTHIYKVKLSLCLTH
jgi:hypothetical protein